MRVSGMRHEFRACGLGVPVVGTRCVDRDHPTEADEQFFPRRLRIAATVLAVPGGGLAGGAYRLSPLALAFHDPFRVGSVRSRGASPPAGGRPHDPIWRCRRRRAGSRPR